MADLASGTYTSMRSGLKSVLRLCQPHTAAPAVKAGAILFSLERSVRDRNDSTRLDSTGHCTGGHELQQCIKSTSSLETRSSLKFLGQHICCLRSGCAALECDGQQLPSPSCRGLALLGMQRKSSLDQHKCSLLAVQSPSLCLLPGLNKNISHTQGPEELRGC